MESGSLGLFEWLILIIALVISIMIIIAVLKIPQIARSTRATMKLTALIAKKHGVDIDVIRNVLWDADNEIFRDKNLEDQLGG